jgi:hypothetical protein
MDKPAGDLIVGGVVDITQDLEVVRPPSHPMVQMRA